MGRRVGFAATSHRGAAGAGQPNSGRADNTSAPMKCVWMCATKSGPVAKDATLPTTISPERAAREDAHDKPRKARRSGGTYRPSHVFVDVYSVWLRQGDRLCRYGGLHELTRPSRTRARHVGGHHH